MVKALHEASIYQAGTRGWLWIKFKRDYRSEMVDTVDLVVVGAFYGRGRRGGNSAHCSWHHTIRVTIHLKQCVK